MALKLLKPEASRNRIVSGRVIGEGALLVKVDHSNVVRVYRAGRKVLQLRGEQKQRGRRVGLWMELIRGRTMEALLKERGPFDGREVARIGMDLCGALAVVHCAGIIHRDIKAENVMEEESERVVLMDFGTGLDVRREKGEGLSGTLLYMAPELSRGEAATAGSDIYSLGMLMYRLTTGGYPVAARTVRELIERRTSAGR